MAAATAAAVGATARAANSSRSMFSMAEHHSLQLSVESMLTRTGVL
jgi:hypothetical protein